VIVIHAMSNSLCFLAATRRFLWFHGEYHNANRVKIENYPERNQWVRYFRVGNEEGLHGPGISRASSSNLGPKFYSGTGRKVGADLSRLFAAVPEGTRSANR
jgi:hypothetical protein